MCHADLLNIIVEDTGAGFKGVDTKDVFQKFSRVNTKTISGSGLGLSIVKGFTEALGGSIVLEKKNPMGSKFILTVPVRTTSLQINEDEQS